MIILKQRSLRKESRTMRSSWYQKLEARTSIYERFDLLLTSAGWIVSTMVVGLGIWQIHLLEEESRRQTKVLETQVRQVHLLDEENKRQTLFLEAQVWRSIGEEGARITSLIATHPEVRPYFEDRVSISRRDKNFNRVMAIAEMKLDFIDSFEDDYVRSLRGMEANGKYWVLWQKYFYEMFENSPALCRRYKDLKDTYTSGVAAYAKRCLPGQAADPAVIGGNQ
jgi:hypothetical protein